MAVTYVEKQQEFHVNINLDASGDARAFNDPKEIIQRNAMENFFLHVSSSLDKARKYRNFLMHGQLVNRERFHDTITISGSRGSGKTTFILSMFELIRDARRIENASVVEGLKAFKGDTIEVLGILDPTLIEEKEHIFIHLLSLIKEKVDLIYNRGCEYRDTRSLRVEECSYNLNDPCGNRPISDDCYHDWLKLLQCLAAGLPSIDGIGSDSSIKDKWHDPVYVLETGLKNTHASNELEITFHRFVDRSLKLLNKEAFIIAFDDIDTHFKRGWPLLEIIRKYLTTPQLITILSGDLELYSILVRSKQWENFGDKILNIEKERHPHFSAMADQLESQYLLKLLKPERRLELRSLFYFLERVRTSHKKEKDFTVGIRLDNNEKTNDLLKILKDIVQLLFAVKGTDVELYQGHLTRETMRSLILLLSGYMREKKGRDSYSTQNSPLLDVIVDIYHIPLQQNGFDVLFLRDPDPRIALNRLVVGLVDRDLLENGYRLKSDYNSIELNRLMMALSAIYNRLLKDNPRLFFDYLVKVGLSREIALITKSDGDQKPISRYLDWSGLRDGDIGVTISRQFTGYIRSLTATLTATTYRGTVSLLRPKLKQNISVVKYPRTFRDLYGTKLPQEQPLESLWELLKIHTTHPLYGFVREVSNKRKSLSYKEDHKAYFFNAVEELEDRISSWHWRLINIGVMRAVSRANDNSAYWSFHTLLAVIGEIAACKNSDEIRRVIIKNSQIRDFPLPDFGSGELDINQYDSGSLEDTYSVAENDNLPEYFIDELMKWVNDLDEILPVHIVAKIFARLYYSMGRVDNDLQVAAKTFGALTHRYIAIFLNAILVEEALYNANDMPINLNNPTGNDRVLLNNLDKISQEKGKFAFFYWMLKCPIWRYFVQPETELYRHLQYNTDIADKVCYLGTIEFENLYYLLNSVLVRNYKYKQIVLEGTDDDGEEGEEREEKPSAIQKKPATPTRLKKPIYNVRELNKLFKEEADLIKQDMKPWVNDSFILANEFIDRYLKKRFSRVSTKPTGRQFKSIESRLVKFMKNK